MLLIVPYTGGDQEHYRKFYEEIQNASLTEAFRTAILILDGYEPVSIGVYWIGSTLNINKDIYISFLNSSLLGLATVFLIRSSSSKIFIFLFLTNYYTIVLMTGAERLKIAYIFLLIYAIAQFKGKKILLILASTSHFQTLILLVAQFIALISGRISRLLLHLKVKKTDLLLLPLTIGLATLFASIFFEGLHSKASAYISNEIKLTEIFQLTIITTIGIYCSTNKPRLLTISLSFIPFVLLLGGERVNMIAFTAILYTIIKENRQNNKLVYLLMTYLSIKSIPFISNIYLYNNGFATN